MPSHSNGVAATPTTSAPASLAKFAKNGAAPVPVPPPIPATTKTRSVPRTISVNSSLSDSTAARASAESPPVPRPHGIAWPSRNVRDWWQRERLRLSVSSECASTPSGAIMARVSTSFTPVSPKPIRRMVGLAPAVCSSGLLMTRPPASTAKQRGDLAPDDPADSSPARRGL